jgi:hypothetical protein
MEKVTRAYSGNGASQQAQRTMRDGQIIAPLRPREIGGK